MANEASIRVSMNIKKGNLDYRSSPSLFRADISSSGGPTPGKITVPVTGVSITFPQLTTPGLAWVQNMDSTNYVEYGIKDPGTGKFYPLGEILPGEFYPIRYSRNLLSDYTNVGTGTDGDVNYLWFKANTAPVDVQIHAFEK